MKKKFNEYLIDDDSADEIASSMMRSLSQGNENRWFSCINSHAYVVSQSDSHFAEALHNADWLIADGMGVV
ncbi:hypothetical protein OAN31_05435, partial [Pseudomonadales bacterium]|nr:hypothetical protein [Pseudomonadales bacterium]